MITAHGTLNGKPIQVIGLTQDELDYLVNPENELGWVQVVDENMNVAIVYGENQYLLQEKMLNIGIIRHDDPNL